MPVHAHAGGLNRRALGTGGSRQYQNPLQTPANGWHLGSERYQKKSCKSPPSHRFSTASENRGVPVRFQVSPLDVLDMRLAGRRPPQAHLLIASDNEVADPGSEQILPYSVRKTDGAYQVVDEETGKVYSRHTTKKKAERQRRLLEGVRHGWKPTGKKRDES